MNIQIETRRVRQNNQSFLLGIFKMSELRKFVRFTRHLVVDYDEETNRPIYNEEVQRKISPSKVDSIADFLIHNNDSFFPTNIVIALPSLAIETIVESGVSSKIILKDFVESENKKEDGFIYITIIDGQHRIAGIEKAILRVTDEIRNLEYSIRTGKITDQQKRELTEKNALKKRLDEFEIIVTFFIDPMPEYQAMVFSTINKTQTKVSEDLVFSLFGLSTKDSPQKTALEVMLALNASEKSPLFDRVKLAGEDYGVSPPLSQRTAVKSVLYQISPNLKLAEIEKNKSREYVLKNNYSNSLIFRKYYGNNEDDKIVKIINTYFKAVRDTYADENVPKDVDPNYRSYWSLNSRFNLLHTTIAFQAFFLIMVELIHRAKEEQRFDYGYYKSKLMPASDLDIFDANTPKKYPLTSKSVNLIYNYIGERVLSDFVPKTVRD